MSQALSFATSSTGRGASGALRAVGRFAGRRRFGGRWCVVSHPRSDRPRLLGGRPGLRLMVLPYPYDTLPEDAVRAHAQALFPQLLEALGATV